MENRFKLSPVTRYWMDRVTNDDPIPTSIDLDAPQRVYLSVDDTVVIELKPYEIILGTVEILDIDTFTVSGHEIRYAWVRNIIKIPKDLLCTPEVSKKEAFYKKIAEKLNNIKRDIDNI